MIFGRFLNDSGAVQLDIEKPALGLHTKASINPNPNGCLYYLPGDVRPEYAPLAAYQPTSGGLVVPNHSWLWDDAGAAQAGNRGGYGFYAPGNESGNIYLFTRADQIPAGSVGIRLYDEKATLIFSSAMNTFRVVDVFQLGWNGASNFSVDKTYAGGRSYAVIMSNYPAYVVYDSKGRQFDPTTKTQHYYYAEHQYNLGFYPITNGFRFVTCDSGEDVSTDYGSGQSSPPSSYFAGSDPQIIILDVTNY